MRLSYLAALAYCSLSCGASALTNIDSFVEISNGLPANAFVTTYALGAGNVAESSELGDVEWHGFAVTGSDYNKARTSAQGLFTPISDAPGVDNRRRIDTDALARWENLVVPSKTGAFTANIWAGAQVAVSDEFGSSQRLAALDGFSFFDDINPGENRTIGGVDVGVQILLDIFDQDVRSNQRLEIDAIAALSVSIIRDNIGTLSSVSSTTATFAESYCPYNAGNCQIRDSLYTDNSSVSFGRNFSGTFDLQEGHLYSIFLTVYCYTYTRGDFGVLGLKGTCDASHSAYWNGVTGAGPGLSLLNSDGQDFRYSSSLSPDPLVVPTGVPDASTWTLLIAGFLSTGIVSRRLRQRRAWHQFSLAA